MGAHIVAIVKAGLHFYYDLTVIRRYGGDADTRAQEGRVKIDKVTKEIWRHPDTSNSESNDFQKLGPWKSFGYRLLLNPLNCKNRPIAIALLPDGFKPIGQLLLQFLHLVWSESGQDPVTTV